MTQRIRYNRAAALKRRERALAVLPDYVVDAKRKLYELLLEEQVDAPVNLLTELMSLDRNDLGVALKPLVGALETKIRRDVKLSKRCRAVLKINAGKGNLRALALNMVISGFTDSSDTIKIFEGASADRQRLQAKLCSVYTSSPYERKTAVLGLTVLSIVEFVIDSDMILALMAEGDLDYQEVFRSPNRSWSDFDVIMPEYIGLLDLLLEVQRETRRVSAV